MHLQNNLFLKLTIEHKNLFYKFESSLFFAMKYTLTQQQTQKIHKLNIKLLPSARGAVQPDLNYFLEK